MREARTWDFSVLITFMMTNLFRGLMRAYLSLPYYYTLLVVLFLDGFVKGVTCF